MISPGLLRTGPRLTHRKSGVAIASAFKHGFTSNGRDASVTMFDLKTLQTIGTVKVGQNPIGIDNDAAILKVVKDSRLIVVGWGRHATLLNRDQQMRDLLRNFHLYCVGINGDGSPEHPLYVRKAILPRPWPIHPER